MSVVRGDPFDALAQAAEESDLLVLGSRGLGAAARFTLGEIGLELVTRTAVPTILVRAQQDTPARIGSGNETVGVSLHAACDGLLAFAFETAARSAVTLRAVHGRRLSAYAYNRGGGVDRTAAEESAQIARDELAAALRPWRAKFPDVHVDEQVILESPAPQTSARHRERGIADCRPSAPRPPVAPSHRPRRTGSRAPRPVSGSDRPPRLIPWHSTSQFQVACAVECGANCLVECVGYSSTYQYVLPGTGNYCGPSQRVVDAKMGPRKPWWTSLGR